MYSMFLCVKLVTNARHCVASERVKGGGSEINNNSLMRLGQNFELLHSVLALVNCIALPIVLCSDIDKA